MKVKVKIGFRDKHTKKYYSHGDVIKVSKERYEEIQSVGDLVEIVPETPGEPEEPKAPEEPEAPGETEEPKASGAKKTKKKAEN